MQTENQNHLSQTVELTQIAKAFGGVDTTARARIAIAMGMPGSQPQVVVEAISLSLLEEQGTAQANLATAKNDGYNIAFAGTANGMFVYELPKDLYESLKARDMVSTLEAALIASLKGQHKNNSMILTTSKNDGKFIALIDQQQGNAPQVVRLADKTPARFVRPVQGNGTKETVVACTNGRNRVLFFEPKNATNGTRTDRYVDLPGRVLMLTPAWTATKGARITATYETAEGRYSQDLNPFGRTAAEILKGAPQPERILVYRRNNQGQNVVEAKRWDDNPSNTNVFFAQLDAQLQADQAQGEFAENDTDQA